MTSSLDKPKPPSPLADVLQDALRRLLGEGQRRLTRAADDGRVMLRVRQLQRDRDALWVRMGKTAYHLMDDGEVQHVSLDKVREKIDALDDELRHLRASMRDPASASFDDPTSLSAEAVGPTDDTAQGR
jgi:hypothetical protein